MPFPRSPIQDRILRAREELARRLGLPTVPAAGNVPELGAAVVGESEELHLHLEWATRQAFPQLADAEGLDARGVFRALARITASPATGSVRFTGSSGSVVPIGQEMRRASDLGVYKTTAAVTLAGGSGDAPVTAVKPGVGGAITTGSTLIVTAPPPGVDRAAKVVEPGIGGGSEVETNEEYRARILALEQHPPAGGRNADWHRWAREVPGVTRSWVVEHYLDVHQVGVYITVDRDPGGPIPPQTKIDQLQAILDDRRPMTSEAFALAPTPAPVDYTITIVPDTAQMRSLVIRELGDLHRNTAGVGETLLLKDIRFALGAVLGLQDYSLDAPAANVEPDPHELPTLGTVTFS